MAKLDHENRIKHSNLMRAFCYDSMEEKEVMPWETMIWDSKWPELSEFLCEKNSVYGVTWDEYEKLMSQFQEVQSSFPWMNKAYFHYIKENKDRFGIERSASGCGGKAILIVGAVIAVSVYLLMLSVRTFL